VSWLFEELWRVFGPGLNHVDKFEFFGRLRSAVNRYHADVDGAATERDAAGAVLHEAYAILDDMALGQFAGAVVTSNNAIHDDAIPAAERERFVTTDEIEEFVDHPGESGE
jgi:hypothetical protein